MKRLLLIINNKTGKWRNAEYTYEIIKIFSSEGYSVTVFPIDYDVENSLEKYLSESRYDKVVCVGGDGTLNRTIAQVLKLDYKPVLGYIPGGTTNDSSANFGLTKDVEKNCDIVINGEEMPFDVGVLNGRSFNDVAAFGAFSEISYGTDQNTKNILGYAAYLINALAKLNDNLRYANHVRILTDEGQTYEGDYLLGALCNSLSVAGFRLDSISSDQLHDGYYELVLIKAPRDRRELAAVAASILKDRLNSPYLVTAKVKSAKIISDDDMYWTLDGESGGAYKICEFKVLNNAVTVMTDSK